MKLIFDGGGIEDLLGLYLSEGRNFDRLSTTEPELLVVANDYWSEVKESDEFKAMQKEFGISTFWDKLIEHLTKDLLTDGMIDFETKEATQNDLAITEMAIQPRWIRAQLCEKLKQLHSKTGPDIRSSLVRGFRDTVFVLLIASSEDREARVQELQLRSLVARGRVAGCKTVVGIATDKAGSSTIGYSHVLGYMHLPEWNDELEADVAGIQKELGYFSALQQGS